MFPELNLTKTTSTEHLYVVHGRFTLAATRPNLVSVIPAIRGSMLVQEDALRLCPPRAIIIASRSLARMIQKERFSSVFRLLLVFSISRI